MSPKQRAGEAAIAYVSSGMRGGLGTGSTADFFIVALAEALRGGKLKDVVGVPTSLQSERRARELGIPLAPLAEVGELEVTVDGADEVAPNLDLIKGLGGALMREKIVAQNSRQMIVIADAGKRVEFLGQKSPLPVEVAKFGHETHVKFLQSLGAEPKLRMAESEPYQTDNANFIYDCRFARIADPAGLAVTLMARAGIVATGLFVGIASFAIVADHDATTVLRR